ncbi:MAG: sigma-70 family RNA polymerase sigma factor [Parvularcula sp.]|jgi:RNA polymerase sigma-70 factor (ECF subfamily)|nr:sigma-70 family RNA polymerase sigma factor [Parvularcula sp.]
MARHPSRILDEYLVVSAKDGDRDAFAMLVRRWQKKLIAHAWRLTGDREAAQDAVQTGWSEIIRGLARLHDERAFPAWSYRIVSRACAKQVGRKVQRRKIAEALAGESLPEPRGADAAVDRERLRQAVRALPPEQRAAIALFHFEELSVAEVAVALDVPMGTVKTRLMHARRKLRAAMEGEV